MKRFLVVMLFLLAACGGADEEDVPLPTSADVNMAATENAANSTATAVMQMTLETFTPTPSNTTRPSATPSITPTRRPTRTQTPTPSDTFTPSATPSNTYTPRPQVVITSTLTPTWTFTPSSTPTRVVNPDAIVGEGGASLLTGPAGDAVSELAPGTALGVDGRTVDNGWLQIRLLNGRGNGWVELRRVILFIPLQNVPVVGGSGAAAPSDIGTPQQVTSADTGTGLQFRPYEFAACGDTYWEGDGQFSSMETLAYEGRYPRFARQPVRVYVHGLEDLDAQTAETWELAISQTFAEISQAVRLERVFLSDLEFFQPWVSMETMLADRRVDMVWHIAAPEVFTRSAPCDDPAHCSRYAFDGLVKGGPLTFVGAVYLPADAPDKKQNLTHAVVHALGLWVHSAQATDLMSPVSHADRLSMRDVRTLRCLYNAPPYGDAVLEED